MQALQHAGLTWDTLDNSLDPAHCFVLVSTASGGMQTFGTAMRESADLGAEACVTCRRWSTLG